LHYLGLQQMAVSKQGKDAINKGLQNRLAQLGVQEDNNNLSEPLLDNN